MSTDEEDRIAENLQVIRAYLKQEFPTFEITEDTSNRNMHHRFAVTQLATYARYKLQVGWPRLSDSGNGPGKTRKLLAQENVAAKMRVANGEYLVW